MSIEFHNHFPNGVNMTNNKHKEIMEDVRKYCSTLQPNFSEADMSIIENLVSVSVENALTEQLEELERWVEGKPELVTMSDHKVYRNVLDREQVLSHIREQKEIINNK